MDEPDKEHHASMLLLSILHLTRVQAVNADYEAVGKPSVTLEVTLDEIRRFRQLDSKTPGHPEYHWVFEESMLVPKPVNSRSLSSSDAAVLCIDVKILTGKVLPILPDGGKEKLSVKIRKLVEINI